MPAPARACASLFQMGEPSRPSLALERALIIYDAAKQQQHFVREVAFRHSNSRFGFIVPTPSHATVATVASAAFDKLARNYEFLWNRSFGFGAGDVGVHVVDRSKVGSFTAFVLAASDEQGLSHWLRSNGLVATPEVSRWLEHYVRLKFHFVALRYDPPVGHKPGEADGRIVTETVRISFETPLPYYPYLEPVAEVGDRQGVRALELWLLANTAMTPVASLGEGLGNQWVRPLADGAVYPLGARIAGAPKPPPLPRRQATARPTPDLGQSEGIGLRDLGRIGEGISTGRIGLGSVGTIGTHQRAPILQVLGPELEPWLPRGELVLQTFQDQKRSRAGFGDIVFVPQSRRELSDEQRRALRPILAILDPCLLGGCPG